MNHPEHSLQRDVVKLLNRVLPHDAFFTAISPLPGSSPRAGAQAKLLGLASGVPDLMIVHHGFTLWIELKAKGGSLSESQKTMHILLNAAHKYPNEAYSKSGTVVVCKSLDEVRQALSTHRMSIEKVAA